MWIELSLFNVLCIFIAVLVIYLLYPSNDLLTKLGIPGPTPLPIVGSLPYVMWKGFIEADMSVIKKYGRICGVGSAQQNDVIISDPVWLKQLLVKDFLSIPNRRPLPGAYYEYPTRSMITVLKDEQWKHLRSILTPSFSSGKLKMAHVFQTNYRTLEAYQILDLDAGVCCIVTCRAYCCMFQLVPLICRSADYLVENLNEMAQKQETFEAKKIFGAYTMDVIGAAGFGIDVNSQKTPDDPFVKNASVAFSGDRMPINFFLLMLFPRFISFLNKYILDKFNMAIRILPKNAMTFFENIVRETVSQREKQTDKRFDLLQQMVDAHISDEAMQNAIKEKSSKLTYLSSSDTYWHSGGLTSEEIIAQGIIILLAGYDTTGSTLSFVAYELAWHPEIQQKCLDEINEFIPDGSNVTYEAINELKFLEKCILETLRLYPPAFRTDRCVNREIVLEGSSYRLPAGLNVAIPIHYLHHSPEYWQDPEVYDPDRFEDGQREENTYHYMPFGLGPRNCIGKRLALLEAKIALVQALKNYRFVVDENKTETRPPVLRKFGLAYPQKGIWIKVEQR